jgi:hypothetical protein
LGILTNISRPRNVLFLERIRRLSTLDSMNITDLPTTELSRLIRISEQASNPDRTALSVLRDELNRRLDLVIDREQHAGGATARRQFEELTGGPFPGGRQP